MARVCVYERPVESVLTNVSFYEKLNHVTAELQIKQEPLDTDDNCQDSTFPLANTNAKTAITGETIVQRTQLLGNVNNKENKLVLSKDRADTNISDADVISTLKRKGSPFEDLEVPKKKACVGSKSPEPIKRRLECAVCFLNFKSPRTLKNHSDYHTEAVEPTCNKCLSQCKSPRFLKDHVWMSRCRRYCRSGDVAFCCRFCNVRYSKKSYLQCHVFHKHNKLLPCSAKESDDRSKTDERNKIKGIKRADKIRENGEISENARSRETSKTRGTSKTRETSKTGETSETSETDEISEFPFTEGTDSHVRSPVQKKENNEACSPTKRMRQTTMTEFLIGNTRIKEDIFPQKVDAAKETPKKVIPKQNGSLTQNTDFYVETPKSSVPRQSKIISKSPDLQEYARKKMAISRSGTIAEKVGTNEGTSINDERSTPNGNTAGKSKPFVKIHIDSDMMQQIFNTKVKVEVEDELSDFALQNYNLRRASRSNIEQPSNNLNTTSARRARNRIRFKRRPARKIREKPKHKLTDEELRAKFKCKDCKLNLVRCDMAAKAVRFSVGEDEDIAEMWRKNVMVKTLNIPLAKPNESTTVEVNESVQTSEMSNAPCDETAKANSRTLFRCKVCKKCFSSKKNLREHLELQHVFYISSICGVMYKTKIELQKHYMKRHAGFKRAQCCVCFEKFSSPTILKQHLLLHCIQVFLPKRDGQRNKKLAKCRTSDKKYSCKACGKRFWSGSRLREHRTQCNKMRARDKRSQKVRNPERTPATERALDDAPRPKLAAINDRPYKAKSATVIRPMRLLRGVALARGYNTNHSDADEKKFSCTICNTQFKTFQKLCMHERTYSKAATYVCKNCNTAFTSERLLRNHRRDTHAVNTLREFKYFCTFCTQGFSKKISVLVHTGHFHAGQTSIIPSSYLDTTQDWEVSKVCSVCNLLFESSERFTQHNMFYYKGQIFTCTFCGKIFHGMYTLHNHIKFEHNTEDMKRQYMFTCDVCDEGFTLESQYHAHKSHVHSVSRVGSPQDLRDHTYVIAAVNAVLMNGPFPTYKCDICHTSFAVEEELRRHKLEYTNDGDYLCSYCARRCLTDDILSKHESSSHDRSNFANCYNCRYCEEAFRDSTELKSHEAHFHPRISDPPRDSTSQTIANETAEAAEGAADAFSCTICGAKFESYEKLDNHSLEYSSEPKFLYNCLICKRRFPELYRLEVHKLKHSNLNFILSEYHCPVCREGFENETNVWMHVMHFHSNTKTEKPANNDVQNAQHVEQNAVESKSVSNGRSRKKLTMCIDCMVTFNSERALFYHKAHYTDAGDHVCEQCGRKFLFLKLLKQHLKRHAAGIGRLKYTCPGCDDRFGNAVARYQHIIHLHGRDMWKNEVLHPMLVQNDPEGAVELLCDEKRETPSPGARTPADKSIPPANSEPVDATSSLNECSDSQEKSSSTSDWLADASEQEAQIEDASVKALYETCPVCNLGCSSLQMFVTHLKYKHGQGVKKPVANPPLPSPEHVGCPTNGITSAKEDDTHLDESRTCNEEAAAQPSEEDADVVEVIWEKKANAAKQIEESDDEEVHILCCSKYASIDNYDKTVSMPEQSRANCDNKLRISPAEDFTKIM